MRRTRQEENESCPTSTQQCGQTQFTWKYRWMRDVTRAPNYTRKEQSIARLCEEEALKMVFQENMLSTRNGDTTTMKLAYRNDQKIGKEK